MQKILAMRTHSSHRVFHEHLIECWRTLSCHTTSVISTSNPAFPPQHLATMTGGGQTIRNSQSGFVFFFFFFFFFLLYQPQASLQQAQQFSDFGWRVMSEKCAILPLKPESAHCAVRRPALFENSDLFTVNSQQLLHLHLSRKCFLCLAC